MTHTHTQPQRQQPSEDPRFSYNGIGGNSGNSGNGSNGGNGGNGSNSLLIKILVAVTVSGLLGAGTSIYTLNAQVASLQSENRANQKDLDKLTVALESLRNEIASLRSENTTAHSQITLSLLGYQRGLTRRGNTSDDSR